MASRDEMTVAKVVFWCVVVGLSGAALYVLGGIVVSAVCGGLP